MRFWSAYEIFQCLSLFLHLEELALHWAFLHRTSHSLELLGHYQSLL